MLEPRKARRTGRPKVRTGCRSCKQRRVKCDETKPGCLRCKAFGCKCDGYEDYSSPSVGHGNVGLNPFRPIASRSLPRIESSTGCTTRKIAPFPRQKTIDESSAHQRLILRTQVHQTHTIQNVSFGLFQTEEDYRYFNHFNSKTAADLRGYFPADVFGELIPQISSQDPTIRQAISAIGALTQSLQSRIDRAGKGFSLEALNDDAYWTTRHYQSAITRYDKAVKLMRQEALSFVGDQHIQKTLVFCLLIAFFETFHGSQQRCFEIAKIAIKILIRWLKKSNPEVRSLALSGIKSPAPYLISDDILQAFARLDRQVVTSSNTGPDWSFKDEEAETLSTMPRKFSSIKEGRLYWELLERQMVHAKALNPTKLHHARLSLKAMKMAHGVSSVDIKQITVAIQNWSSAFDPVYLSSRSSGISHVILVAAILAMRAKLVAVTFPGEFEAQETFYDDFSSQYWDLISLGKKLQEDLAKTPQSKETQPRFDKGPSQVFSHIAITCRDRKIRQVALKMANAFPKLDGLMGLENDRLLSIARFVNKIEEDGLSHGFDLVPERARICCLDLNFLGSLTQRYGPLRYTKWGDRYSDGSNAHEIELAS